MIDARVSRFSFFFVAVSPPGPLVEPTRAWTPLEGRQWLTRGPEAEESLIVNPGRRKSLIGRAEAGLWSSRCDAIAEWSVEAVTQELVTAEWKSSTGSQLESSSNCVAQLISEDNRSSQQEAQAGWCVSRWIPLHTQALPARIYLLRGFGTRIGDFPYFEPARVTIVSLLRAFWVEWVVIVTAWSSTHQSPARRAVSR